jgi:hypothetical protein
MTSKDSSWARRRCIALLASSLAIVVLPLAPASVAAAPAAAIRTGGPSASGDSKVAIVAGAPSLRGSRFAVYRGHRVVLRGLLRPASGSSAPWPSAFRANLSVLHRPGRYRIHAAGRVSRPWRISRRGSDPLVPLILRFFRTNRDGAEAALLHGPSHLNDAVVAGGGYTRQHFDLTGGWMDAGDMLHFTQTTAYATMVLEAAARLDPIDHVALNEEADVGVRWLLKAHPAPGLFVTQVGDVRDHQRGFSNPAHDDASKAPGIRRRRAYHWGPTVGGDIGGKVAAALAMAAERNLEPARGALLAQAQAWYEAGKSAGRATPPIRHAGDFYVVSGWRNSLAAGAAALYRATGEPAYLADTQRYLAHSDPRQTLGYADAAPLAAADVCGRLGAPALGPPAAVEQACRFLRHNAQRAISCARRNAFGPAGPFTWGTTSTNGAGGAMAALSGLPAGRTVAAGARDYLLGRNPWGASFLAGFGPQNPRRVHSWASLFGARQPRGAVVGGPAPRRTVRNQGRRPGGRLRAFDSGVVYEDSRQNYVTSEPALDYAANSILLLASLQPHGQGSAP